jgi:hypothetical protein
VHLFSWSRFATLGSLNAGKDSGEESSDEDERKKGQSYYVGGSERRCVFLIQCWGLRQQLYCGRESDERWDGPNTDVERGRRWTDRARDEQATGMIEDHKMRSPRDRRCRRSRRRADAVRSDRRWARALFPTTNSCKASNSRPPKDGVSGRVMDAAADPRGGVGEHGDDARVTDQRAWRQDRQRDSASVHVGE